MNNKVKFVIILAIVVVLGVSTIAVYQNKYDLTGISGFAVKNESGSMNWHLIALIAQWLILFLALVLAAFHYLSPYQYKY